MKNGFVVVTQPDGNLRYIEPGAIQTFGPALPSDLGNTSIILMSGNTIWIMETPEWLAHTLRAFTDRDHSGDSSGEDHSHPPALHTSHTKPKL